MWVALSAEVLAAHTVSIPPHVCVNGSMAWQRATCLTWWDLQDHPLARANRARPQPGREAPFSALQRACGHRFSTCFQALVRNCPCTLTERWDDIMARASNWMQSEGVTSYFTGAGKETSFHVWKSEKHNILVCIWTLWGIQNEALHTCWQLQEVSWLKLNTNTAKKQFHNLQSYKTKVFMTWLLPKGHKQHPESSNPEIKSHSSQGSKCDFWLEGWKEHIKNALFVIFYEKM